MGVVEGDGGKRLAALGRRLMDPVLAGEARAAGCWLRTPDRNQGCSAD
jgi:hypothetical protein